MRFIVSLTIAAYGLLPIGALAQANQVVCSDGARARSIYQETAGRLLELADLNRNGSLSRREWINLNIPHSFNAAGKERAMTLKGIKRNFEIADENHDGKLTKAELTDFIANNRCEYFHQ